MNERLLYIKGQVMVKSTEYESSLIFSTFEENHLSTEGFWINEGENILIIGANASGKTKLLRRLEELMIDSLSDKVEIIKISDSEISYLVRAQRVSEAGRADRKTIISQFLLRLENQIKEVKKNNKKLVVMIDGLGNIEETDEARIIKTFEEMDCTVIRTQLIGRHFSNWPLDGQKFDPHYGNYTKKILIGERKYNLIDLQHDGTATNRAIIKDLNFDSDNAFSEKITLRELMVVNSSTEKNIEFYEKLGHFWMQKTIISKINSRSEKLTEFVDIVLSELRYSKKFFSRAKAREKDIVDIEITKRKLMNLTKQADLLESMIEEAEAKNDDMKMAMLQDEQEMSEREIRDMQVFLESRMNMMKKIEESGRERLEMIQKIIVIKDNISQIVQESGLSRFNKKVLDIDVILTENGFYTIGKNKILSEVELVQIKEMNNQIGQMQNYVEDIRKKLMKKEEAQVLQQQLTRENKAPNLSDGSNRFEINEIKSSLSLILSDLEEGNTSDDLRRLGLYYSNKFLQLPNGEYSKITKKLIVVNSIEKFLKYSVNTFYDRENTNIILHDSTSEDFKPFWKDRRSVGMVFRPTTNPSADIFIIDCDGEILPRHIKKYLNIYRKEGTAREGHLLFIDINNTYTSGRVRTTNHPFNKWLKNLDRRTKTREQSQSAGLPDIIEIRYQNKNSIHQPSKKANDLLPKNIKEFNRKIRSNWKEVVDYTQKSKVKFNCINPEIVNFWLSVDIGGTIVTEERIFGLKQLDTSIEKGNFDEALSNVEDIISMTKTKLEEFDISYQLKIILQYLLNGYINSPESLTMKYNINEIYKSLSMEYTPKTGFPYLQESLQSDFHRFAACLPNINLTKCMLTLKNKEDFSEITLLSEAGRDINKIWSRPTAGSYGYYSQGNIFDIVFSPLVKLKIPQYNFEFVGNKIVSDYESKMRHLKEIKNFSYDDDESNFWSRIGMGWTILINENRINDLFDLMDLCDSRDSSILFSLLMDQAISDPKIEVKKHLRQMEYLIDEYVLSMLENDKKINKLIYLKNLGLTDKTKRKIIKEIKSYDFETNKDLFKTLWKKGDSEDSLINWYDLLIK